MQNRGAVIIPSYQPDRRLMDYLEELNNQGIESIIVVNDGSSPSCQPIFEELARRAIILTHEENQGKGRALKTAYRYIREELPSVSYVVTADADGQHAPADVKKLLDWLQEADDGMVVGVRDFNLDHVPPRNAFANKLTSRVFHLLFGKYLRDTQTGLRGFYTRDFLLLEAIKGERFEYEMNVLTVCVKKGIPIGEVPIQTIYAAEKHESHYQAGRDSLRIAKQLAIGLFAHRHLIEETMPEIEKGW